jgi:hypothetical protein
MCLMPQSMPLLLHVATPGRMAMRVDGKLRKAKVSVLMAADQNKESQCVTAFWTGGGEAVQANDLAAAQKRQEMWMIVGFEVMPCSVKREYPAKIKAIECHPWPEGRSGNPEPQPIHKDADIVYSYDVLWEESAIEWASRWDAYLRMSDGSVHWFSILNSMLVVLVMSVIVAVILMRTVRRDLARYEELLIEGPDAKEESGWKLVSGDVFRMPPSVQALAVQVCQTLWLAYFVHVQAGLICAAEPSGGTLGV